jgi:uncharacterized repeat protein (TIGR03803 family)
MIGGKLFGTSAGGGKEISGTVFALSPPATGKIAWEEELLYTFSGLADGGFPIAGLLEGPNGSLFGTTATGGAHGVGVVYQLTPPAIGKKNWTEHVIYSFSGAADGANPIGALVSDSAGNLYGTAAGGGKSNFLCLSFGYPLNSNFQLAPGCGTVFKLSPPATGSTKWSFTLLHVFLGVSETNSAQRDGGNPLSTLALGSSGAIYGTTSGGGSGNSGTIFEITP